MYINVQKTRELQHRTGPFLLLRNSFCISGPFATSIPRVTLRLPIKQIRSGCQHPHCPSVRLQGQPTSCTLLPRLWALPSSRLSPQVGLCKPSYALMLCSTPLMPSPALWHFCPLAPLKSPALHHPLVPDQIHHLDP